LTIRFGPVLFALRAFTAFSLLTFACDITSSMLLATLSAPGRLRAPYKGSEQSNNTPQEPHPLRRASLEPLQPLSPLSFRGEYVAPPPPPSTLPPRLGHRLFLFSFFPPAFFLFHSLSLSLSYWFPSFPYILCPGERRPFLSGRTLVIMTF
jgi:hypothetical protein